MIDYEMRLDLFDGSDGGEGAAGPSAGEAAQQIGQSGANAPAAGEDQKNRRKDPEPTVRYGKRPPSAEAQPAPPQPAEQPEDPDADFRALIEGKYKAQFGAVMQDIIGKRIPDAKRNREMLKELEPLIEAAAIRHGIQRDDKGRYDVKAVVKAERDSDDWVEREAERRNLDVPTTKHLIDLERGAAEREQERIEMQQREQLQIERERNMQRYFANKAQEAELQKLYPSFSLDAEIKNPKFAYLVEQCGVDVATAFAAVHHQEILSGSLDYVAKAAQQQLANAIAVQGRRPAENGSGAGAPGTIWKDDPRTLTKADRARIKQEAARGKKIYF